MRLLALASVFGSFLSTAAPALAEFSAARFEGDLLLKDVAARFVDHGAYDPGHTEFELLADYAFIDEDGREWRVPKGSVVNGASIPSALWSAIGGPWSGPYRNAAVIHDWMCEARPVDSDTTHAVFYQALRASGVSERLSLIMYVAVLRGGPQWDENAFDGSVQRDDLSEEEVDAIIRDVEAGRLKLSDL